MQTDNIKLHKIVSWTEEDGGMSKLPIHYLSNYYSSISL